MDNKESFYDIREQNKIGLQSFFLDLDENHFDNSIDDLILQKEKELKNLNDTSKEGLGMFYGTISIPQELFSLSEMKIIYCFKNFENKLKILIKGSYNKVDTSKMYRWDNVTTFLKSKQIDIKKLKSYKEVNQLRNVNNSIKHSKTHSDNEILNIEEFKNVSKIDYSLLLKFYERVKNSPMDFISELSQEVFHDLYSFDEKRILNISESILLRMDRNHVQNLIKNLKKEIK